MRWRAPFLAALTVSACGSSEAAAPPTVGDIGELPVEVAASEPTTSESTTLASSEATSTTEETRARRTTTTTVRVERPVVGSIGRLANGNRLLMIGDSIMASTAERYSGEMCARLVPMGWAVEMNAETGREIGFGLTVLERRLSAGWDAAVIFLGNNYPGPAELFARDLNAMLSLLAPRPVVVVTVSEYEPRQAEVNYLLRSAARTHDNVRIVEWTQRTATDDDLLISDDLHPSAEGRQALVAMIAQAVGRPSRERVEPRCMPTAFVDDTDF